MKTGIPGGGGFLGRILVRGGAFFSRTETEFPLKSRRVIPGRLSGGWFRLEFPQWPRAATHLAERFQ